MLRRAGVDLAADGLGEGLALFLCLGEGRRRAFRHCREGSRAVSSRAVVSRVRSIGLRALAPGCGNSKEGLTPARR